jgi:bifunctional pyridoxal-dependent enzyme with beta-cystathionase and maltose regulon repressor activities
MLGADFQSLQEFINACIRNRTMLNPQPVLGKVYSCEELRYIANYFSIINDFLSP